MRSHFLSLAQFSDNLLVTFHIIILLFSYHIFSYHLLYCIMIFLLFNTIGPPLLCFKLKFNNRLLKKLYGHIYSYFSLLYFLCCLWYLFWILCIYISDRIYTGIIVNRPFIHSFVICYSYLKSIQYILNFPEIVQSLSLRVHANCNKYRVAQRIQMKFPVNEISRRNFIPGANLIVPKERE